jgi:hypothetical protein
MKALNTLIGALIVVGASAYAAPSQAATAYRIAVNHATAACMGTLPVDRDMTQVASSGMANIKRGLSDVKCGGSSTPLENASDVEVFEAALRNSSNSNVTVNCTVTDGMGSDVTGVTTSYLKSVTILAGQVAWLDWTTDDTGGSNYSYPSLSCQLATNVTLIYTAIGFQEDVGL